MAFLWLKHRLYMLHKSNVFWKNNLKAEGTFKSIPELKKLYEDVADSKTVVTYCNEGLHAVPAWFVLSEILGKSGVRVYDRSMSEWGNVGQHTAMGPGRTARNEAAKLSTNQSD